MASRNCCLTIDDGVVEGRVLPRLELARPVLTLLFVDVDVEEAGPVPEET